MKSKSDILRMMLKMAEKYPPGAMEHQVACYGAWVAFDGLHKYWLRVIGEREKIPSEEIIGPNSWQAVNDLYWWGLLAVNSKHIEITDFGRSFYIEIQ
jgi:hypothetical protein